jgi:signal recognition particle subunit SRP54
MKFIGIGKCTQDLEPFYSNRMALCILGIGNVISLVERAPTEVTLNNALVGERIGGWYSVLKARC